MQALEQAIDASRCAHISPSRNNLGSYFQDLVSFSSMFRRLGRADILPNANYSEVLCQLEHTVDDLNHTVSELDLIVCVCACVSVSECVCVRVCV